LFDVIPAALRKNFKSGQVYVRGIAEEIPMDVFYSQEDVILSAHSLQPITIHNWELVEKTMTVSELTKLVGTFTVDLPSEPISLDKTKFEIKHDHPTMRGYSQTRELGDYKVFKDAAGQHLRVDLEKAKNIVKEIGLTRSKSVIFRFQYVPKPGVKKKPHLKKKKA